MGGAKSVADHWATAEAFGDDFNGSPCMYLPIRPQPSGYVRIGGGVGATRKRSAHVAIYEELVGPVPENYDLDHLCRNRGCVNPWHCEPVPGIENTRRGVASRVPRGRCGNGHDLTGDNAIIIVRCRVCLERSNEQRRARYASDPEKFRAESTARYARRKRRPQ